MKIYTSYFANKNIPSDMVKISISRFSPNSWNELEYKKLAPPEHVLLEVKQTKDSYTYIKKYIHLVLNMLNKEDVLSDINKLSGGKDVVLMCYEKPTSGFYCHRQIVGKWLNIPEYSNDSLKQQETPLTQLF